MKNSIFIALMLLLAATVSGQVTTQGFLNLPRTEAPGTLLNHPARHRPNLSPPPRLAAVAVRIWIFLPQIKRMDADENADEENGNALKAKGF